MIEMMQQIMMVKTLDTNVYTGTEYIVELINWGNDDWCFQAKTLTSCSLETSR